MNVDHAANRTLPRPGGRRWGRRMLLAIGTLAGLLAAADGLWWSGWRVNLTESEPLGFYRLAAIDPSTVIRRGALIEFCPPAGVTPARFPFYMKGNCPGGGMPMFKQVVGVPGDRIDVSLNGESVNGRPLPYSAQLARSATWPRLQLPHQARVFVLGQASTGCTVAGRSRRWPQRASTAGIGGPSHGRKFGGSSAAGPDPMPSSSVGQPTTALQRLPSLAVQG